MSNPVDHTTEEGQGLILRMRNNAVTELAPVAKQIKEHCKCLLAEPYVEGATPPDVGMLDTIRHQLLVEYINTQTSRLDSKFGDDEHKTRYLRRAVIRMLWAKTPL